MCTVRSGICVHSCERVSGIDGEERNLSSFSLSLSLCLSIFFFVFFSLERRREKEFEILSHTHAHIHSLLLSCLYTCYRQYIVLWNFRIVESNEPRRRRQRHNREKKRERERETYKMDNDDVDGVGSGWENEQWRSSNWTERKNDGWIKGLCRVRETKRTLVRKRVRCQ